VRGGDVWEGDSTESREDWYMPGHVVLWGHAYVTTPDAMLMWLQLKALPSALGSSPVLQQMYLANNRYVLGAAAQEAVQRVTSGTPSVNST
jgi:hypothetical protein